MAQLKNPPAPVSKTVQRLLAQNHAEAEAATLAALSAKDGIVTLQPMPAEHRYVEACTPRGFWVRASDGSNLVLFIDHADTDYMDRPLIGPRWSVATELKDGQGRTWRTQVNDLITDDFGNLVSVEGGAA